ncbi:MAG: hypothetical protein LQ341_001450 [Variospora aurantia]|nr:MAG: hypothetical protein LQ341_001450 [Variospora aurantia]
MPRDTPPPVPSSRRHHTSGRRRDGPTGDHGGGRTGYNANLEPLGKGRGGERVVHGLPPTPEAGGGPARVTVAKTTYEAKPVVRDLRKEAVRAFMPAVVARKVGTARGEGGAGGRLLEEEEVEKLETEGYAPRGVGQVRKDVEEGKGVEDERGEMGSVDAAPAVMEADMGETAEEDEEQRRLKEEEERFSREVRMDEVSDEDL